MTDQETTLNETQISEEPTPAIQPRKRTGLIIGGVLLLVVLIGAAFVGGQLLNRSAPTSNGGGGMSFTTQGGPGGGQAMSVEIVPAKELPATPPDSIGLFARRGDQSIVVSEVSGGQVMVMVDESGKVSSQSDGASRETEIVVTADTVIYRDATQPDPANLPADGKFQQKVEPGALDEIGENSFVSAWGERRGDRLIARVIMYSRPMVFAAPSAP